MGSAVKKSVLFVCLGNICRSPMAEAMARQQWGEDFDFGSAGIIATDDSRCPDEAIEVARERSLDLSRHQARNVSNLDLLGYDIIVALTPEIALRLSSRHGARNDQLREMDVADPYGEKKAAYEQMAQHIATELRRLMPSLLDQ